ncbi:hypothetical protein [Lentibacillus sp. Marseille-P4043]|uniref:hypothetical protein n=1 Tax=Lentibacillus sp. Marseille-P4043 TaxID=2040293 RepID=UPI00131A506A|nr:hypothetical protein [Lentibacillus sp. Marseille-P4043]
MREDESTVFLLAMIGDIFVGDIIFQLFLLLMMIAAVAGVILLFVKFRKRNERLARVEEKLDKVLSEKEK